jgi:oligopeptidase A
LSGIGLDAEKKARYKEISLELSRLASKYEENLLDATNAWQKLISKKSDLAGLPESALQQASLQNLWRRKILLYFLLR